jgi:hypothetical protein
MKGPAMLERMTLLFPRPRRKVSRGERRWREMAAARDRAVAELTEQLLERDEALRKLESINRIQQVEIDELSAVVARNLERVKAETRELGGATAAPTGVFRLAAASQENETDA